MFIKDDIFRKYTYINILYNGGSQHIWAKSAVYLSVLSDVELAPPSIRQLNATSTPRKPSSSALYRAPPFFSTPSPSLLSFISIFPLFYPFSPTSNLSTFFYLSLSLFHNTITLRIVWRISHEIYLR